MGGPRVNPQSVGCIVRHGNPGATPENSYGFESRRGENNVCMKQCRNARAVGNGRSPRKPDDQRHRPTRGDLRSGSNPIALVKDQQSDRLTAAAPLNGTEIIAFTTFPDFCLRKDYTRPSAIKKDLSSENKSEDPVIGTERCLRSSVDVFNIKQDCLYCGEEASVRKKTKITTSPFKYSVIARALERGDAWGEIVHARAVIVADLVAAEAKYHKQCRLLFASPALPGLKGINIRELATSSDATAGSVKNAIAADVLWSSARWLEESSAPSWNGFMRSCIHIGVISCITAIEAVTFIHLDPSHRKIITAAPPAELDSATLRLGGFHRLVSFMGSIGFIMSGSGIEELWMHVYAKSSVTYMISGHTFSRAV
ncbi:hypothetical protein PR048_018200 [Dryococelus australis]|uniref:Uncharacterized protein n=1 Tax=Dryococelus australis TaxID=614101 RepID=A0ABQ9HBS0_9NEOP|nr:hypothetical protein PR048_018200 [Dryococelus australis]